MKSEPYRVLILLPEVIDDSCVLAYCSALQAFRDGVSRKIEGWNSIYRGQEKDIPDVILEITNSDQYQTEIFNKILVPDFVYAEAPSRKGYAYVADLRQAQSAIEHYQKLGQDKHITQFLGILTGAECTVLPTLVNIPKHFHLDEACDLLISDEAEKFCGKYLKSFKGTIKPLGKKLPLGLLCTKLNSAKLVLSEVSLETYMASAFHIHVMELMPVKMGRQFLSKFANPNYRQYVLTENMECNYAFMTRLITQWEIIMQESKTTSKLSPIPVQERVVQI